MYVVYSPTFVAKFLVPIQTGREKCDLVKLTVAVARGGWTLDH